MGQSRFGIFYQYSGAYLNPLLTKFDNALARYNNCTSSDNDITDIIENMHVLPGCFSPKPVC